MYHVYILLNEAKTRTYTGVADDVEKRLKEHNTGRVKSSSPYRPYKVIHMETFATLSEARQREKFYKSTIGRRRIKEMFFSQHPLPVGKDVVLFVQDVQDASIRLQEDLIKDMPDAVWTVDSDGLKVLRYTEQDKLNLTAEPRIELKLTADGAKKFADFTRENIKKSVAVIGDNRVLAKVMIMEPIESGKIQIFAPTDKVNEMIKLVESMGLKLKVKSTTAQ